VTRGTKRLHVAAQVVSAKRVHFDMVDLEALVKKFPATHAEPLLRSRNLDLLRLRKLSTKAVAGNEIQPRLAGGAAG